MKGIWIAIKELLNLPEKKLPLALLMIACAFMGYQWIAAVGRADGKEIELRNKDAQILQFQIDERNREREFTKEKNEAVIKVLENCEMQKIDIYKKLSSNAGKNHK